MTCVLQDGGDFFLTDMGDPAEKLDSNEPAFCVSFREKVKDGDLEGAEKARKWFKEEFCPKYGIEPYFL